MSGDFTKFDLLVIFCFIRLGIICFNSHINNNYSTFWVFSIHFLMIYKYTFEDTNTITQL